jgi:small subunit ribosomal protein S15
MVSASPSWVPVQKKEAEDLIVQMGKMGKQPAQIGLALRDQHGVPNVRLLTGKSILQILDEAGIKPQIPEDLASLIVRGRTVTRHLSENKKDESNRHGLNLIESKIRRLVKYYVREGIIPANWHYSFEGVV